MGHSSNDKPRERNRQSCNLEGVREDLPRSTLFEYLRRGILLPFRRRNQIVRPSSRNTNNSTSTSLLVRASVNSQSSAGVGLRRYEGGQLRVGQALEEVDVANLRQFTLSELKKATKNFRPDTLVGEGGFGQVYKGFIMDKTSTNRGGQLTIAVKRLNREGLQGIVEWQTELKILGRLSHPNLIKLLGYAHENDELLLVYEFMRRGSLDNHLFGRGAAVRPLSWDTRLKVMIEVARAVSFLHSLNILCRDVKTSNVLLDEAYTAKLSDFGLAKFGPNADHSHVSTRVMGTYGYAAPEYMATGHLNVKSDVYGFGIVMLEMLTGLKIGTIFRNLIKEKPLTDWVKSNLLNRGKMISTMDSILEGKYPSKLALKLAQLTLKCIQPHPQVRPSMEDVVKTLEKVEAANEKLAHKLQNLATHSRALPPQGLTDGG